MLVNVVMDVSVREATSKIMVCSLVELLVVIVAWFVGMTPVADVPTMIMLMNFSIVVVVFLLKGMW